MLPSGLPRMSARQGRSPTSVRLTASKVTWKPPPDRSIFRLASSGTIVDQLWSRTVKKIPRSTSTPCRRMPRKAPFSKSTVTGPAASAIVSGTGSAVPNSLIARSLMRFLPALLGLPGARPPRPASRRLLGGALGDHAPRHRVRDLAQDFLLHLLGGAIEIGDQPQMVAHLLFGALGVARRHRFVDRRMVAHRQQVGVRH